MFSETSTAHMVRETMDRQFPRCRNRGYSENIRKLIMEYSRSRTKGSGRATRRLLIWPFCAGSHASERKRLGTAVISKNATRVVRPCRSMPCVCQSMTIMLELVRVELDRYSCTSANSSRCRGTMQRPVSRLSIAGPYASQVLFRSFGVLLNRFPNRAARE